MDEDGAILPPGQRGEIVARGDLVFAGYYEDPQATEEASRFGWHHTGDVGYRDENGFVYIVDRKKDMIVTGGFNVFSAEVEHVIAGHPAEAWDRGHRGGDHRHGESHAGFGACAQDG
jgi:acyl-CoA synthetase (AMP-forming)/AMP-acid ligase II